MLNLICFAVNWITTRYNLCSDWIAQNFYGISLKGAGLVRLFFLLMLFCFIYMNRKFEFFSYSYVNYYQAIVPNLIEGIFLAILLLLFTGDVAADFKNERLLNNLSNLVKKGKLSRINQNHKGVFVKELDLSDRGVFNSKLNPFELLSRPRPGVSVIKINSILILLVLLIPDFTIAICLLIIQCLSLAAYLQRLFQLRASIDNNYTYLTVAHVKNISKLNINKLLSIFLGTNLLYYEDIYYSKSSSPEFKQLIRDLNLSPITSNSDKGRLTICSKTMDLLITGASDYLLVWDSENSCIAFKNSSHARPNINDFILLENTGNNKFTLPKDLLLVIVTRCLDKGYYNIDRIKDQAIFVWNFQRYLCYEFYDKMSMYKFTTSELQDLLTVFMKEPLISDIFESDAILQKDTSKYEEMVILFIKNLGLAPCDLNMSFQQFTIGVRYFVLWILHKKSIAEKEISSVSSTQQPPL